MEAGLWRICPKSPFSNIRFDYNAVATPFERNYHLEPVLGRPVVGFA
jgi:hypothetical protein